MAASSGVSRLSRKRVVLVLCDVVCLLAAHLLAIWIRFGAAEWFDYLKTHVFTAVGSLVLYLLCYYTAGLYSAEHAKHRVVSSLVANFFALVATGLVFYARPTAQIGRGVWLITAGLMLLFAFLVRRAFLLALHHGFLHRPAYLITHDPVANADLLTALRGPLSPYRVEGILVSNPVPGVPLPRECDGIPILGRAADVETVATARPVSCILLETPVAEAPHILGPLRHLRYAGVEIVDGIALGEILFGRIPLKYVNENWLMNAAMNSSLIHVRNIKRVADVIAALLALVPGIPALAVCALLIKLTDKGPVFYRQTRVGRGNRPFTLYKLRSMRTDAEKDGAVWAGASDARVTRVGHYLRKFRLDEIPQVFNILKGEMSFVGPRPERPEFTKALEQDIPYYAERTEVLPGLTGWAQVKFPYAASLEATRTKLEYDLFYLKNMSLLLDAAIALQTVYTILAGLHHEDDESMAREQRLADMTAPEK